MRGLLILLLLAGCGATPEQALTGAAAISIGSITIMQRDPFDALYSIISGRDCSIVRLEQDKSYCKPLEPPPEPLPFCTRTLGTADCWRDPASLPDHPRDLGDIPHPLTPVQNVNRTQGWPRL